MSILKIAHRGASAYAPENTLLAVRKALELGADGIECDVQLCKSGEPVVIHDDTLNRTTSGRGKVASHTLAELQTFDAGQGERIPTLEKFIREAKSKIVYIELKEPDSAEPVATLVHRLVKEGMRYEQMVVISFLFDTLRELKQRHPDIIAGASIDKKNIPEDFLANAKASGMVSVNPNVARLTRHFVDQAHALGLKVITWTANKPEQIEQAKNLRVDGIISDYPDRL